MKTIRLPFFILTHLCTKFSSNVLLTSAQRQTAANCLKDNEHSVMWFFFNLLNKHKQFDTNAKKAKGLIWETLCCLFIGTPCSSVSLSITPWRQWCGRRQCAVSTVTDWSLWAVGRHHLLFTVQMFVRETDWDEKGMRVCVCVCLCGTVLASLTLYFMSVWVVECAPPFSCMCISLSVYVCVSQCVCVVAAA